MNTNRMNAVIVGALFLTAMVASLLGGSLVESALSAPDTLLAASENKTQVIIGVLLELLNGIAVVGIGVLLFPILKQHSETVALGYMGIRIVEAVFCSVIVISPLSLIAFGQEAVKAGNSGAAAFQAVSALSLAERASVMGLLVPVFFSLGALLLYSSLVQSKLLPRFISIWGLIAAILILINNLASQFVVIPMGLALIFVLPIILNEIFLGIWLIVKGFNPPAIVPVKQA